MSTLLSFWIVVTFIKLLKLWMGKLYIDDTFLFSVFLKMQQVGGQDHTDQRPHWRYKASCWEGGHYYLWMDGEFTRHLQCALFRRFHLCKQSSICHLSVGMNCLKDFFFLWPVKTNKYCMAFEDIKHITIAKLLHLSKQGNSQIKTSFCMTNRLLLEVIQYSCTAVHKQRHHDCRCTVLWPLRKQVQTTDQLRLRYSKGEYKYWSKRNYMSHPINIYSETLNPMKKQYDKNAEFKVQLRLASSARVQNPECQQQWCMFGTCLKDGRKLTMTCFE